MIGARLFNQQENSPLEVIFGAVTTGTEWQFLKLEGDTIFIEKRTHSIENLAIILGILQNIIDSSNQIITA